MKVDLYCVCYNESKIAPFILDYWAKFVTNAYVYDNGSTDNVLDILRAEKRFNVELRQYDTGGQLNDAIIMELKNSVWKDSRGHADFVVVCDFDEALYAPLLVEKLQYMQLYNQTVLAPIIYELTSETMPEYDPQKLMHETIGQGMLHMDFGKHILFDPNKIKEMNYSPGAHQCYPTGAVAYYDRNDIYLFHCKRIDIEYHLNRYLIIQSRMSEINKQNCWGVQYMADRDTIISEYMEMLNKSIKLEL